MANQNEVIYTELMTLGELHMSQSQRVQLLEKELREEKESLMNMNHAILKHMQTMDKKSLAVYVEGTGKVMLYYRDTHSVEEKLRVEGPIELLG